MIRPCVAALLSLAVIASPSVAQDAATRKANRNIHAQEKEILRRVTQRLEFDKKLEGSTIKVEAQPGGVVALGGSVMNEDARQWAVEVVEDTVGVTSVVDQLAVVKEVKVHDARPTSRVAEVPTESRVIIKP